MIKFIFGMRLEFPVLAHSSRHRVTGLTLPPVDANLFHRCLQLAWSLGEEVQCVCSNCNTHKVIDCQFLEETVVDMPC